MKQQDWIVKRKSVRKYKSDSLNEETLVEIEHELGNLKNLISGSDYNIAIIRDGEIVKKHLKGLASKYTYVKAPHYLILTSQDNTYEKFNLGFVGEQVVKKLTNLGLGTCWVGAKKDLDALRSDVTVDRRHDFSILIAFGQPVEPLKFVSTRKRKAFGEILPKFNHLNELEKYICEGVQSAPSAVNNQPWRFVVKADELIYHMETPKGLLGGMIKSLIPLDCGIGLFHIFDVAEENAYSVNFEVINDESVDLGKIRFINNKL